MENKHDIGKQYINMSSLQPKISAMLFSHLTVSSIAIKWYLLDFIKMYLEVYNEKVFYF